MNTIGKLISILDPDFLLLTRQQKFDLVMNTVLYTFRAIQSQQLTEVFARHLTWPGKKSMEYRGTLKLKGYLQKNLKMWLYKEVVEGKADPKEFEIAADDVKFFRSALKSDKDPCIKDLRKVCRSYSVLGHVPRSLTAFDEGIAKVCPELLTAIQKFVSKKFLFLTQSSQLTKDEIEKDLLVAAIYGIYRAYPEIENLKHLYNIGFQSMHNRGVNVLKEQTTQSRVRLLREEDGSFTGRLLSLNTAALDTLFSQASGYSNGGSIITCNALMADITGASAEHMRPGDMSLPNSDLRDSVDKLMANLSGTARRLVLILMGEPDEGFSEHLGGPNEDLIDSMDRKAYVVAAYQYLGVRKDKAYRFHHRLRSFFSGYAPPEKKAPKEPAGFNPKPIDWSDVKHMTKKQVMSSTALM
jgi:hypothetical protein